MAGFNHIRDAQNCEQRFVGQKAYARLLKDMEKSKNDKARKAREVFNRMPYNLPDNRNVGDEYGQI